MGHRTYGPLVAICKAFTRETCAFPHKRSCACANGRCALNRITYELFSDYRSVRTLTLSVTQSAFASTSDRPLCFPRACVGLIGPRPSDYPHALSACYYFLPAVFLLALGLWSSLPARQLSLDTSYSFLIFSVFFFFFFFF